MDINLNPLVPRREIEQRLVDNNHFEKRGMVNKFICANCHVDLLTYYEDPGVTPHTIRCHQCGGDMVNTNCKIRQIDTIWYRPRNLKAIRKIAKDAFENDKAFYEVIMQEKNTTKEAILDEIVTGYVAHYNKCGLFNRKREQHE